MGHQYLEVSKSHRTKRDWVLKPSGPNSADTNNDGFLWMHQWRDCSILMVGNFSKWDHIACDPKGKITEKIFMQLISQESAEKALEKHKERIEHRYIEVIKSGREEVSHTWILLWSSCLHRGRSLTTTPAQPGSMLALSSKQAGEDEVWSW